MSAETNCPCGTRLEADDLDALVGVTQAHITEVHADWQLTPTSIANYVYAEPRLTGGTERLEAIDIDRIRIEPVSSERLGDILSFFDHDAFADNPAWAACYCVFHHVADYENDWPNRHHEENRAELAERIQAGTTTGAVAYVGDQLAGWVNASPVTAYPHHVDADHGGFAADEVGAVTCFVVAPPYRGHGLARRLLDAACRQFAAAGMKAIEAYPLADPQNAAAAYHGPVPLLLEAGFERITEPDEKGSLVMRRRL